MYINYLYSGYDSNGIHAICQDSISPGFFVEKVYPVLHAEESFLLKNKKTEEITKFSILLNEKEKDNYTEVEVLEELNDLGK